MSKILLNLNDLECVVGGALAQRQVVVHVFTQTNGAYVMHSNGQVAVIIPQDKYRALFDYFDTDDGVVNYFLNNLNNQNIFTYFGQIPGVNTLVQRGARISLHEDGEYVMTFKSPILVK